MRITVCEMADEREKFADGWAALVEHVRRESSELVLLPEMPFYHWFCSEPEFRSQVWKEAVEEHARWIKRVDELGSPVVLGTSPVEKRGARFNEGFVWTKSGTRGVQLKNYVPNIPGFFEASWYQRGDRTFSHFDVGRARVGFLICSDLWSPTGARVHGKAGAHLLAVPRASGKSSVEKWLAGGRVASVVSGAFCLSSNRTGERGEAEFGGKGWVVDPDGEVLGLTSSAEPFLTVEVDLARAEEAKKTYPRNALEPD